MEGKLKGALNPLVIVILVGLLLAFVVFQNPESKSIVSVSKVSLSGGQDYFLVTQLVNGQETINFEKGTSAVSKDGTVKFVLNKQISVKTKPVSAQYIASALRKIGYDGGELWGCGSGCLSPTFGDINTFSTGLYPYYFASSGLSVVYGVDVLVDGQAVDSQKITFGAQGIPTGSSSAVVTNSQPSLSLAGGKVQLQNLGTISITQAKPNLANVVIFFDSRSNSWYRAIDNSAYTAYLSQYHYQSGKIATHCEGTFAYNCDARVHDLAAGRVPETSSTPGDYANFLGNPALTSQQGTWNLAPGDWQQLITIAVSTQYADRVSITPGNVIPQIISTSNTGSSGCLAYQKQGQVCAVIKNTGTDGTASVQFASSVSVSAGSTQQVYFNAGETKEVCANILGQNSDPSKTSSYTGQVKVCPLNQFSSTTCVSSSVTGSVCASGAGGEGTALGGDGQPGDNASVCIPFLQKKSTASVTSGGFNLPLIGNIGGTQQVTTSCDWDFTLIVLLLVLGIVGYGLATGNLEVRDLASSDLLLPVGAGLIAFLVVSSISFPILGAPFAGIAPLIGFLVGLGLWKRR